MDKIKQYPALLWLPAWVFISMFCGLQKPGVFSDTVHWTESVMWSLGYTGLNFALAYLAVKYIVKNAHPIWRVVAGCAVVLFVFFWNNSK